MKNTLKLLTLATEAFPPGENQHHGLYVEEGRLVLCLFQGENYQQVSIDEEDFQKEPETIISEIKSLLMLLNNKN